MNKLKQNHNPAKNKQKGKMNPYFASKSELLTWANTLLDLELRGIEETITGAVFCQLLDATYPGTVRLNKVNWKANTEVEYQSNFKIFQQGLIANNIEKTIDISRLSKGKFQELVELFQWLYGLHHSLGIDCSSYNALKVRNEQNFIYKKNVGKNFNDNVSQGSFSTISMDQIRKKSNNIQNNCGKFSKKKINQLNANLRGNNFYTKYNSSDEEQRFNSKKDKSLKWRHNHNQNNSKINNSSQGVTSSKKSMNDSHIFSNGSNKNLSFISNFDNSNNRQSINDFNNYNYNAQQENINIFNNASDLDINLFEGLNELEKNIIKSLEQKDGNDPLNLKILIRKLRVENIKLKNNMNYILKEKDFYLNKLKDVDYLYFNPQIKNDEQSKNQILKTILSSCTDTTISLDPNGFAFITGMENMLPNNRINLNQNVNLNNNGINLNQTANFNNNGNNYNQTANLNNSGNNFNQTPNINNSGINFNQTPNIINNGINFNQTPNIINNGINFNQTANLNNNGINLNQNNIYTMNTNNNTFPTLNVEADNQKKFAKTKKLVTVKINGKSLDNNNIHNLSKCSVNEIENNISKRSQPLMTNNLMNTNEINNPVENNNENNNINNGYIVTPFNNKKMDYNYDISEEILNDSLHIPNIEK